MMKSIDLSALKRKWGIYSLQDLGNRCRELGTADQLIEGLIPARSLTVVVGDSGLGKSPLLYQAGLSIASGSRFLGKAVRPGRVLYMDAENGLGDVDEITSRISGFLGLREAPPEFIGWNLNDCPSNWEGQGGAVQLIRDVEPDLVIIDPATAFWPDIQERNKDAAEVYQQLRRLMRDANCAIILVHHIRKNGEGMVGSIADGVGLRAWFEKARGPRSIINGCDVRLAVDEPGASSPGDAALVLGGFGRVRGSIPLIHLERAVDENGEPVGYKQMVGVMLLPPEQRQPFEKLPNEFRFKDARACYGKGGQATTDWLGKCVAAGIVEKCFDGWYRKTEKPPLPDSPVPIAA